MFRFRVRSGARADLSSVVMVSTRPLGSTGLVVTSLGLGVAALGRPAYINLVRDLDDRSVDALRSRTLEVADAAYAAGIRYFDTARSYGRGEEFVAHWLTTRDVPDAVVGSKWGYRYVGDWRMDVAVHEVKDHSLAALEEQLAESRRLLGERLNLYQVHSATLDSGVLADQQVLARLTGLAESGVAVGLSVSGPAQADTIRAALAVSVDGVNPFSVVQATWNLFETSAGSALAEAAAAGWGVIVKEALANGRLVVDPPPAVAEIATAAGVGADAVAIAAALARPWATVVLSGASTVDQLTSNLAAAALGPEVVGSLPDLAEDPGEYWQRRSGLTWH
jgi:aryl-alcohol dehydrogenase-like predicted oxidoreductase